MSGGVIVKVWNVSAGNAKNSASKQMGSSIDYIFNAEKCSVDLGVASVAQMGREVTYVVNDIKTLEGQLVGGRHIIDLSNAVPEMLSVKDYFRKPSGRIALHGMLSLEGKDSDLSNAPKLMALCDELMEKIFPDNQCVYAVHTNTNNLHVHFILNTVGLDGKKIHMDNEFMTKILQPEVNRLAKAYGFTPNSQWGREPQKDPLPIVERKIMLRQAIDLAIENNENFDSFVEDLKRSGFSVSVGKYMTLKSEDMSRPMRTYQLGSEYTVNALKERIKVKRYDFIRLEMDALAKGLNSSEMMIYTPKVLKKYKDMNPEERMKTLKALRLGKNP